MPEQFLLIAIPLFFAIDPLGLLPIFASLTQHLTNDQRRKVIMQSVITASVVAFIFLWIGQKIFDLLTIKMGDFMIAGGMILFVLALREVLSVTSEKKIGDLDLGAVPLGTPLIVGPAVLTMGLMMSQEYGIFLTMTAIAVNIFIVAVVFSFSHLLIRIIGVQGARALSKVMALLLAAIGVMMIRRAFGILWPGLNS